MPNIEKLFDPQSASLRTLFVGETAFEIPPYQRPYRWMPSTIRELLEDIVYGLERTSSDPEAVTFLGAIITVGDVDGEHVNVPQAARMLIDGQQRITTLLMIAAAGIEVLGKIQSSLKRVEPSETEAFSSQDADAIEWIEDQIDNLRSVLRQSLVIERGGATSEYRGAPRVVRESVDKWAFRYNKAEYRSPIGRFIDQYLTAEATGKNTTPKQPEMVDTYAHFGSGIDDHKVLIKRYTENIVPILNALCWGSEKAAYPSRIHLPDLLEPGSETLKSLFPTDDSIHAVRDLMAPKSEHEILAPTARALLLFKFLVDHIVLTEIQASNASYAFDIFDCLNTTGEPLTALETFLPLVVREEGDKSLSYKNLSRASELFDKAKLQAETRNLMVFFLAAELGEKVSRAHNDQRRLLDSHYKHSSEDGEREAITRQLLDTAVTYDRVFKEGQLSGVSGETETRELSPEVGFALGFLSAIDHTVVIAPISRYVAQYRAESTSGNLRELEGAILAFTAFSAVWRGARGNSGIDQEYRSLMKGWPASSKGDVQFLGLSRSSADKSVEVRELPTASELGAILRGRLADKCEPPVKNVEDWVRVCLESDMYQRQAKLARLLILMASHNAAATGNGDGLLEDCKSVDNVKMLIPDRWADKNLATLEHVFPQSEANAGRVASSKWDEALYQSDRVNHLGNLALSPLGENVWLSDRPWDSKRVIYRALVADKEKGAKSILEESKLDTKDIGDDLRDKIVTNSLSLPMLAAVADVSGEWTYEVVKARSENILRRSWVILDKWLRGELSQE